MALDNGVLATTVTPSPSREYVPIGALRLQLALMVFLGHALDFPALLRHYQGLGLQSCGVAVFFIVSGYVILSAYTQFYHGRVRSFLINRFLRIFPPFWVTYLAALLLAYLVDKDGFAFVDLREFVGAFFLFGGYLQISAMHYVPHAWTLVVEVQFYLAAALIFFVARRHSSPGFATWIMICATIIGYAIIVATNGQQRFFGSLQYAPLFGLGAVIFAIRHRIIHHWPGWIVAGVLFVLSIHEYSYYMEHAWPGSPLHLAGHAIFVSIAGLFVFLTGRTASGMGAAIDRRFGSLTYHFYLSHLVVVILMKANGFFTGWGSFVGALVLSLIASWLLEQASDRPLIFLRNRIRGRLLN